MRVCLSCLHDDDRDLRHCPRCGDGAIANASRSGYITSIPVGAGMACQRCQRRGADLEFRRFRRVVGMVLADRVYTTAGYLCAGCRRVEFWHHLGLTLVLGWWGYLAMFFRNPSAIALNVHALFAPPGEPSEFGAMSINDLRDAARRAQHESAHAQDVPDWVDDLSDDELALILTDVDYYAVLELDRDATAMDVKAAWRRQLKQHHPDVDGDPHAHVVTVLINDAYRVLGDAGLRDAYHRRAELFDTVDAFPDDDAADLSGHDYGCRLCELAFASFDAFADHVDAEHPDTAYDEAFMELLDGAPVDGSATNGTANHAGGGTGWRCRTCGSTFQDYDAALDHADTAHPERTVVDVRNAVERVS